MKIRNVILVFISLSMFGLTASAQTKRKIVKYRSHTNLDFSEQMVQGKIRSPDVFYIFQRKRSQGPQVVQAPDVLQSERRKTHDLAAREGL